MTKVIKTDQQWAQQLSQEEFDVCRNKGTEAPFTGRFWNTTSDGVYHCLCCDAALFSSETKFDAGCGWPSFYDSLDSANIKTVEDNTRGMRRVEIMCAHCDSHLGHVFPDGPQPTGDRYCVNSLSLSFNDGEGA